MQIEVIPVVIPFYDDRSGYCIMGCNTNDSSLKRNKYKNVTLVGNMIKPKTGIKYRAIIDSDPILNGTHGYNYKIISIEEIIPTTNEERKIYLKMILTDNQVNALYDAYPNEDIIDLFIKDELDYNKVSGMGEITYLKIRKKIVDNIIIQKALVKLGKYGVTYKMITRIMESFENVDLALEEIERNPYCLIHEVNGIGFIKADEIALAIGIPKTSEYRIFAGTEYILNSEANKNGHSWISIDKALFELVKILQIEEKIIKKTLKLAEDEESLKNYYINDGHIYVNTDKNQIALASNYFYELRIYQKIIELIKAPNTFAVKDIDNKILKIEQSLGFPFTKEQKKAIYVANESNILIVNGRAGTGKSSVLSGLIGVATMEDENIVNYDNNEDIDDDFIDEDDDENTNFGITYATCALSGKAANRITESTGLNSSTIHRLLGYRPNEGFNYNAEHTLPYHIVALDEGSMVGNWLYYSLVTAIKNGKKFIMLADIEQLEPIGAGFILRDLIESGVIPVVTLTEVHRQAEKSGILSIANKIREGKQVIDEECFETQIMGELQDLYIMPMHTGDGVYRKLIETCKTYKGDIMNMQVIVPMKKNDLGTNNLNKVLQDIYNSDMTDIRLNRGKTEFRLYDKVIQCGNNYETGVFNGTIGRIEYVDKKKKELVVKFIGLDLPITYTKHDLDQLELAYALTVHRCQGSQVENLIFAFDYSSYIMLSKQLVYTGLTRAMDLAIMICENKALSYAIRTDKAIKRNTFLSEFLEDYRKLNLNVA